VSVINCTQASTQATQHADFFTEGQVPKGEQFELQSSQPSSKSLKEACRLLGRLSILGGAYLGASFLTSDLGKPKLPPGDLT